MPHLRNDLALGASDWRQMIEEINNIPCDPYRFPSKYVSGRVIILNVIASYVSKEGCAA